MYTTNLASLKKKVRTYAKVPSHWLGISCIPKIAYDNLNEKLNWQLQTLRLLDREIKQPRQLLVELQDNGINVIIISHALYDEKTALEAAW